MTQQLVFKDLLAGKLDGLAFEYFREGVEICRLTPAHSGGGTALALLRYRAGASVPLHQHPDIETIFVLQGDQIDDLGVYRAGDVIVNLPGSKHRVRSSEGCLVMISWAAPVEILE